MSDIKFQMIYGSRENLLSRPYQQGQVMLVKDSQQIIFNIDDIRRSFYGFIYLATQYDRTQIQNPNVGLYLVMQTGDLYYYDEDWKKLSNKSHGLLRYANFQALNQLTQCDENSLYLDQQSGHVYYGINLLNTVLWINITSASSDSSQSVQQVDLTDYSGDVQLKDENDLNILNNSNGINVGNSLTSLNLHSSVLSLNGNQCNTSNGLVQLDQDGKIPQNLIPIALQPTQSSQGSQSSSTLLNARFQTIIFDVQNLTSNKKFFSYQTLGIEQPTIVQLIDQNGLVRDDTIPMYWGENNGTSGLWINFEQLVNEGLIDQNTGDYKLKYLIAQQYNQQNRAFVTTLGTKIFDPYLSINNSYLVRFSLQQLGLAQTTMIQLVDDQGLIRDDIIPVYWENGYLNINFQPISSLITQQGFYWKIKYLVSINSGSYATKTYTDEQIASLKSRIDQLTAIINNLLYSSTQSNSSASSSSIIYPSSSESSSSTSSISSQAVISSSSSNSSSSIQQFAYVNNNVLQINSSIASYNSQSQTLNLSQGTVENDTLNV